MRRIPAFRIVLCKCRLCGEVFDAGSVPTKDNADEKLFTQGGGFFARVPHSCYLDDSRIGVGEFVGLKDPIPGDTIPPSKTHTGSTQDSAG